MRVKLCYFVVFNLPKSKCSYSAPQFWSIWPIFPDDSKSLLYKLKKTQKIWAGWGLWAGDVSVIQSGRRYIGYAWEVKSQIDSHLSHRKTKHYITRWKVMCFCVIEFKKRSHWIAQDIFSFLLWTSDTLPVQSSCIAPEMISLLRKAKIIFQEPVVIADTTSNKLDIGRTEGGAPGNHNINSRGYAYWK